MRESLVVLADPSAVAAECAARVSRAAREAIAARGQFTLALTGGSSPLALYDLLAAGGPGAEVDWSRAHVFFGDERAVPPDSPQSNYGAARARLLSRVPVPAGHVHRMEGERPDLERAAAEYEADLVRVCGAPPALDLLLLGVGGDAHILSLFPRSPQILAPTALVVAHRDPPMNPKLDRITFTPGVIDAARAVLVIVSGADKAAALARALNGPEDPAAVPAQLAARAGGGLAIVCDRAAAPPGG